MWRPSKQRQDAVADFCREDKVTADIRKRLDEIADLERIVARVSTFRASGRDLVALAQTLRQVPAIRTELQNCCANLLTAACRAVRQYGRTRRSFGKSD